MEKIQEKRKGTFVQNWIRGFIIACGLVLSGGTCFASTITLQWDPLIAPDLGGYKVYYSSSPTVPFVGTGAIEGASPVSISTQNKAIITGLNPGQAHYFAVTAYSTAGYESPYSDIVEIPELISPTVFLSYPANNATLSGTVSINVNATDNLGIAKLELFVNGVLQETYTNGPYVFSWNTTLMPAGAYTLNAKAYDAAGNVGESTVSVTVANDLAAPIVVLAAPDHGVLVRGVVPINANATDDVGVSKVEFYVDGSLLTAGNVAPYSYEWDTTSVANGSYTISAKAYDATGKVGDSSNILVTVQNDRTAPAVSIAAPTANTTDVGTVTVSADASDDIAVTKIEFLTQLSQ